MEAIVFMDEFILLWNGTWFNCFILLIILNWYFMKTGNRFYFNSSETSYKNIWNQI